MQLTGKTKIFGKEIECKDGETRTFYSTTVASKNKEGEYVNFYMNVKFPNKEPKLKDGMVDLELEEAFLGTSLGKDEVVRPEVVVLKWKSATKK